MKVEGEKLVLYLAAHREEEGSGIPGRRELIKAGVSRWILPGYCPVRQTRSTVAVWSSSGRSMRGQAMKSDITSSMKPLGRSFRD
jgi:hypothetical protein